MKKTVVFFLMFALLAAVLPAAADSVWMPMDDYFMTTWDPSSDNTCEYLERPFYMAAGKDGYVTAVRTPLDRTPLKTYPNGTEFQITFVCGTDNDLWGAVESVRPYGEVAFHEDYKGVAVISRSGIWSGRMMPRRSLTTTQARSMPSLRMATTCVPVGISCSGLRRIPACRSNM